MLCSIVPEGFKRSYIVPIPKPKEVYSKPLTCDDFRGIAISPVLAKTFEQCILDRFASFFSTSPNQFGFLKKVLNVATLFAQFVILSTVLFKVVVRLPCVLQTSPRHLKG